MYYLQSRYYDPAVGRFINADSYAQTYETANGANMFAYALNNPVKYADDDGEAAHIVAGAIIGAVMNVATSWFAHSINGETYSLNAALVDAGSGALSGALAASGVGLVGAIAGNAAIGGASYLAAQKLENESATFGGFMKSVIVGGISGAIGGKGANAGAMVNKYKYITQKLTTMVSPKKISMYNDKIVDMGWKVVGNAGRSLLASFTSNYLNTKTF